MFFQKENWTYKATKIFKQCPVKKHPFSCIFTQFLNFSHEIQSNSTILTDPYYSLLYGMDCGLIN
jgi:hypothetical protein